MQQFRPNSTPKSLVPTAISFTNDTQLSMVRAASNTQRVQDGDELVDEAKAARSQADYWASVQRVLQVLAQECHQRFLYLKDVLVMFGAVLPP